MISRRRIAFDGSDAAAGAAALVAGGGDPWRFIADFSAEEVERNHIRVALDREDGNRVRAAKAMGISERTLYRKIREYGLRGDGEDRGADD